jgi:hypothetical protein
MKALLIKKNQMTFVSLLISSTFMIYIYLFKEFSNNSATMFYVNIIIMTLLAFSPVIFYKNLIKLFTNILNISFRDNLIEFNVINSNGKTSIYNTLNLSELNSYTITMPQSFYKKNDFIKIKFRSDNKNYKYCFVNETISDDITQGNKVIEFVNTKIKEYNLNHKQQQIVFKKSFFAANIGKYFIIVFTTLLLIYILLTKVENNHKIILIITSLYSIFILMKKRQMEMNIYLKYNSKDFE